MTDIEQKELRGITLKQVTKIIGYAIAVVSCIISLVIRDINRSNEVATLREKIQAMSVRIEVGDNERKAIKTDNNNLDKRLIRIETIMNENK